MPVWLRMTAVGVSSCLWRLWRRVYGGCGDICGRFDYQNSVAVEI